MKFKTEIVEKFKKIGLKIESEELENIIECW